MKLARCLLPLPVSLLLFAGLQGGSTREIDIDIDFEQSTTPQLLAKADSLLSNGRGNDALELYDLAVDREKGSYLNFYRRGTAHLALGHTSKALDDFARVLALTEFDQARLQMSRIQLRQGSYSDSLSSVSTYLARNKADVAASELKKQITTAQAALSRAEKAREKKNWEACITAAAEVVQISSASTTCLEVKAGCQAQLGRIEEAVGDLTRAVSLSPSSPSILTRLSLLSSLYLSSAASLSLAPLKQCLHFDPESPACKKLFRSLKSLEKDLAQARNFIEGGRWRAALELLDPKASTPAPSSADQEGSNKSGMIVRVKDLITHYSAADPDLPSTDSHSELLKFLYGWTCKAYTSTSSTRLAAPFCSEALRRDPESVDGLIGVGETALKEEKYEEAVRHLSSAFEKSGRSDRSILERVQKAQRLLKQSKAKDYYKVLGVSRDADTATIKKAYRKATLKAHPDKEGGSEAAMAAVNEAWQVLGNQELRARFDNGDDPNDPMSGHGASGGAAHGGGGHPFYASPGGGMGGQQFFQQFFQQGGGGGGGGGGFQGQQFKFNFG